VKSPVFPWGKFPGVDTVLGPEMKSTGEVMGVADNFGEAFAKAQAAAGQMLPITGTVFMSGNERDKPFMPELGKRFVELALASWPRTGRRGCWKKPACGSSGSIKSKKAGPTFGPDQR